MGRLVTLLAFIAASNIIAEEVHFKKLVLTDRYYCDGVTSGDIDGDGDRDLSGQRRSNRDGRAFATRRTQASEAVNRNPSADIA